MDAPRQIIHLDLDAFFCAVEEQHNPALRGKAFAVGGKPSERGVVASCSYAARQYGVRSAMPMARALRQCPHLMIVPSRHGVYSSISKEVMKRIRAVTGLVEQVSIDEAFLDVSGLGRPAEQIARELQAAIRRDLELPCSLGVAANKLVAKIANDVGKASVRGSGPPNALTIVPPGQEAAFLAPLPVATLWGIGPKTAARLEAMGIHTIGELANWSEMDLIQRFGKHGEDMARRARGIDDRPIVTSSPAKSFSQENTFARDVSSEVELRRTLRMQADQLSRRLRKKDLRAATVKIKLRWPDFTTLTRQTTLDRSTDRPEEIAAAAESLFGTVWAPGKAVRLLGVGVSGLTRQPRQLSLWDAETEKERRLQEAVSELRSRFGEKIVVRGNLELDDQPGDED